ncbi:unnamed protein product, partial [Prorocentrum cordatum]
GLRARRRLRRWSRSPGAPTPAGRRRPRAPRGGPSGPPAAPRRGAVSAVCSEVGRSKQRPPPTTRRRRSCSASSTKTTGGTASRTRTSWHATWPRATIGLEFFG